MKHGHILFSYSFDQEGKAIKLDSQKASEELRSSGLSWVHLDGNHKTTKKWLQSEVSYLDHLIIDALLAEETRPRIMEFEGGILVILRGINLNANAEPEDMVSVRMWIDSERVITIQRRDMKAVFDLCADVESGKTIKTPSEFLYNLLYNILSATSSFFYVLNEKLDDLEERIMTTHDIKLREEILQIRIQSTVFKRYLVPQRDVISRLRVIEISWIDDWSKRHFQENFDQITHMLEEIDESANRSKILHDELANALTEKLNTSMYKLSLITLVFMPLTFLTGLFGMNVGGIPGSGNSFAFYLCSGGMFLIAVLQFMFFKRKKWF
jgi:zinc transporter